MDTTTRRRPKPLVTGPGYQTAPRGKAGARIDRSKQLVRQQIAARNREVDYRLGNLPMAARPTPPCPRCHQPLLVEPVDIVSTLCSDYRASVHLACVLDGDEFA
jgi:hypothetical protein